MRRLSDDRAQRAQPYEHDDDDDALRYDYSDRAPEDFVVAVWYGPGTRYRAARDAEQRIKKLWGDRVKRRMPHCAQRVAFLIRGPAPSLSKSPCCGDRVLASLCDGVLVGTCARCHREVARRNSSTGRTELTA